MAIQLTEKIIRDRTTELSFQRGLDYYLFGTIWKDCAKS
jgi:hypothetical protein